MSFEAVYCTILICLCIVLYCLSVYNLCPRYAVMIDDVGNVYLEKGRKMYYVLGYDEHYVYILRKDNQKYVVPNREIKCLDLLYNGFYYQKNKEAGD